MYINTYNDNDPLPTSCFPGGDEDAVEVAKLLNHPHSLRSWIFSRKLTTYDFVGSKPSKSSSLKINNPKTES